MNTLDNKSDMVSNLSFRNHVYDMEGTNYELLEVFEVEVTNFMRDVNDIS